MAAGPMDDPVLARFRAAVEKAYGSRIARRAVRLACARRCSPGFRLRCRCLPDGPSELRPGGTRARRDRDRSSDGDRSGRERPAAAAAAAGVYAERTAWIEELRRDGLPL